MKKFCLFIIAFIFIFSLNVKAQSNSSDTYHMPDYDTLRVFLVFAELTGDPQYDDYHNNWLPGQLPYNPNDYFDTEFNGAENINSYNTKYYYQASFGDFVVLGDYYPELVQIDISQGYGKRLNEVIDYLHNLPGSDIITAHGKSVNSNYFDEWETPTGRGTPEVGITNERIDVLMILWRVNSNVNTTTGGSIFTGPYTRQLKNKIGFDEVIVFRNKYSSINKGFQHEYAHSLLGNNLFHTAGNVMGNWHFITGMGGYSSLCYSASIDKCYSAYERRRLDWIPDGATNIIRAVNPQNGNEVNADLIYGDALPVTNGEFLIRDFVSTGDAIRIKLPYLQTENPDALDQWLWIENRQKKEENIDVNGVSPKGIYAYIQVGKETLTGSSSDVYYSNGKANYAYFLHPYGNYDFHISNLKSPKNGADSMALFGQDIEAFINNSKSGTISFNTADDINPFTGYNFYEEGAFNLVDPNGSDYDEIYRNEILLPNEVIVNGSPLPPEDLDYQGYTVFGTAYDAFTIDGNKKISIGSNPASNPVMTYQTGYGHTTPPYDNPQTHDNRKIYLNGLSVELLEQYGNGDIKVKIKYNDFDVANDTRWCSDIVLNEKVNLLSDNTILIDQGLMATRPVNPIVFSGEKIFASPTVFTCNDGSEFIQNENSTVIVDNGSTLHLKGGSKYIIKEGAELIIKPGEHLKIDACAEIVIEGTGKLITQEGVKLEIEDGAILAFENALQNIQIHASVNIPAGYIDPRVILPPAYIISSSNEQWNNKNYKIYSNIVIENGADLDIINSSISVHHEKDIIINTGGKLIIDNSTVTALTDCGCTDLWKGITVLGNSELPQWSESNQGVLEIMNNAVIEHAEYAVTVGSLFFNPNNGINGGIVKLSNVTFKDNERAVYFYEYQNYAFNNPELEQPNASYISNCTFETTDYLANIGKYPKSFVTLYGVDGVTTYQSSFTNSNPEAYSDNEKGKGVKLISANSSVIQSNFQNLRYGIFTQGTSDYYVLNIKENSFTDNITGIYAEAAGNYTVYDNDFEIPGTYASTGIEAYYNTETFTIEENRFTSYYGGNETGIYAAENSANLNLYKNTFSGIKGGIVLYNNPNLQVECNEFTDCYYGVYFNEEGGYWAQGTIRYPAGNKFSNNFNYHLYAWEDAYSYFHDSDLSNPLHATLTNDYVTLIEVHPDYYGINECLSHFGGGGGGGISIEMLAGIDEEINENEIILASITDGGDTEGTVEDVENAEPDEALKLRNKLLEKSPNLSDTVMINATTTEDVLPSIMLTQVLSENPQAAKSGDIKDALDNRANQLPYYMRDAIDMGRFSTSLKEDIESEIAILKTERARIYSALLAKYSSDTTQTSQDSLLLLMQNETDLRDQYRLMSYYMSKKDRVNAQNVFNSIPDNFELSAKEENEYNAMTELNNVLFNLIDEEKSLFGADSSQVQIFRTLSEDTITYAGAYARGIMTLIDTVDHISVFPMPEEGGDKGGNPDPIFYPETFAVYPNPANDYFIIEYALSEKESVKDISIALFDNAGTELMNFDVKTQANQFLAECEHLKEGIYWCRKFNKGKVIEEEKVIIGRGGTASVSNRYSGSDNTTGYELVNNNNNFKIYPNPAKDYFFITYNLNEIQTEEIIIQITDSKGVVIKEIRLDKSSNKQTISSSDWVKGVYNISLRIDDDIVETNKLIIK
ncbi:MAG: T9SS type A sorting domain-containing protein [Bacteroidales bacterium]|nr:T9SS type A sorting domain-containing protein [Bacteroidales bacterium]